MTQSSLELKFISSNKCFLLLLCLFLSFSSYSQSSISFKDLSDIEVLDKVADQLGFYLNYNNDILKLNRHSFSVSGSPQEIIDVVSQKLGLDFLLLEENIYAIRPSKEASSMEEPSFGFKVLDEYGEALPFCNIILKGLGLVFQSDNESLVIIKGFFSDDEQVTLSYVGYETLHTQVSKVRNQSEVIMKTADHVLGEIVISDFLRSIKSNDLSNIESLQEINVAGISDQDILNKAQLLPGIHSTSESLNDLQIRGGPPDQVSYKWNEIRLLQNSLFYGKVSGVNPFLVDDISITRNGASAEQSGQASGSILLQSSEEIQNRIGVKFFTDLIYSNLGLSIPVIKDKLALKLAYRRSYNDLINTKAYNDYFDQTFQFGQLENDQFYIDFFDIRGQEEIERKFMFDDLSGYLNWKVHPKLNVKGYFVNIGNDFSYNYFDGLFSDATKSDQLTISNLGYSVEAIYDISQELHLSTMYSGSQYENHQKFIVDLAANSPEDRFKENDVRQNQLRADLTYVKPRVEINVGVQNEFWKVEYIDSTRVPALGLFYNTDKEATDERSAYAKAKWTFIPRTVIETGLRYSDFSYSLVGRKFLEPRLHISHKLNSSWILHAHYGRFHQNLNRRVISTPLEVEKGIWFLSDERPESDNFIWVVQNRQSSVGVKYLLSNWKFTLDAYSKSADNIWTSALDFAVEEDPFAFADLFVQGLEFSSHFQNTHWRLLWTYELTDEELLVKVDPDYRIKSPFTQKHKLSLMTAYSYGRLTVSSRWRYNSGRRFSEGERFITETEPELYYGIEYAHILGESIAPYHSLDLSIQYEWKLKKQHNQEIEVGIHLQNIYNRRNVIKRQYYIDYTKTPFEMAYYDRLGIGFFPNLSLTYSFIGG